MTTPEPPLTTEEFAEQVRRDPQSIRRWVKKGIIIGQNVRGRVLIPRSEIERLNSGAPLPRPGLKKGQKLPARNRQNALRS